MINNLQKNPLLLQAMHDNSKINNQPIPKNDTIETRAKSTPTSHSGSTKLETIKDAIQNGTYEIDLKGSAEKMAQHLLG